MMKNSNQELNQLTKSSLKTALIQLLAENSVDEISVTSLTKRAGVSRMAYYRNYHSITALYHDVYADYFQQFFKYNIGYLVAQEHKKFWEGLFNFLFDHKDVAKILLSSKENPHFLAYLNFSFCTPIKDPTERYLFRGVVGSVFNVLIEWVQNDFDLTPQEIAKLCLILTERIKLDAASSISIQKYWQSKNS